MYYITYYSISTFTINWNASVNNVPFIEELNDLFVSERLLMQIVDVFLIVLVANAYFYSGYVVTYYYLCDILILV